MLKAVPSKSDGHWNYPILLRNDRVQVNGLWWTVSSIAKGTISLTPMPENKEYHRANWEIANSPHLSRKVKEDRVKDGRSSD